jgi:hypothetical protein
MVQKKLSYISLPSFLKQSVKVDKAIQPYEENILKYIINCHNDYELLKKTKHSILKSVKRVKVVEFFNVMCTKYKLKKRTLFLSSYYYDRYQEIYGSSLASDHTNIAQACLLMAMKYEEIYPPFLKDWCLNPE